MIEFGLFISIIFMGNNKSLNNNCFNVHSESFKVGSEEKEKLRETIMSDIYKSISMVNRKDLNECNDDKNNINVNNKQDN